MTRPPMRILFFGDADSVHLQRWVAAMAERGAECHVATRRPGDVPGAASVSLIRPGSDAAGWFLALPQVRRLTRALAPDFVHGHYVTSSGLWAAASGHARVALTAWGSDILLTPRRNRFWRALTGWILRRAGLITADSQDVLAEMGAYGVTAPMHEILWGADTDRFTPPPAPRGDAPVEWLSLRAWEPNYQVERIVQAYADARRSNPDRMGPLHLLGGGSLAVALRTQVQGLRLGEHVVFHGRLDDAGMQAVMRRCAVSVSVPRSDATSVSVLESMACGMALLVSDLPANRQWVDPRGGVVVPVSDGAALARAMADLAQRSPADLAAMGAHNRAEALARASRRAQMDLMYSLYQQWLAAPLRRPAPPDAPAAPR
jgi:glycosyltransferase involved in cell wall biosynthesis